MTKWGGRRIGRRSRERSRGPDKRQESDGMISDLATEDEDSFFTQYMEGVSKLLLRDDSDSPSSRSLRLETDNKIQEEKERERKDKRMT